MRKLKKNFSLINFSIEEESKKEDQEFLEMNIGDKDFQLEVLNHMWNIMISGNQISINLVGEALKCLTEILSRNFSSKKMEFVHRSIECISSNTNLHESLLVFFRKITKIHHSL